MRIAIALLGLLGLALSPSTVLACSCADLTPRSCNLLSVREAVVFVGTVENVENPPREGDNNGGTARYHFRVEEWFSADAGSEVDVQSGRGGADCSVWFETGIRYLVFSYRDKDGQLWSNVCTNTQSAKYAGALIAQLRAMRNGQPVARVYGTLWRVQQPYAGTDQPGFNNVLGQVELRFESPNNKAVTRTADDGTYALYDLPPGSYRITADLPANLELGQTILDDPLPPLQLRDGACLEHDLEALPTGRIRGQLIGSDGRPLWNSGVELFLADHYGEDKPGRWEFVGAEKKYFEFSHLAPGEYILVFNRDGKLDTDVPYPRTFFANGTDLAHAQRIRLAPGEQLVHADIQLSGGVATRTIRIRVVLAGGAAPTSSSVWLHGSKGEEAFPEEIEKNIYEVKLLPDSEYSVKANTLFCEPETESQPVTFLGASAPPELTITVPDTKCRTHPKDLRRKKK